MNHDELVRDLANRVGFSVHWTDQSGADHIVQPESLRRLLQAMGFPCDSPSQAADSTRRLADIASHGPEPLVTAWVGEAFSVPGGAGTPARLTVRDAHAGDVIHELTLGAAANGRAEMRPILEPGFHTLVYGDREITVAVAPRRGYSIDAAGGGRRMWGLAAQVYGLVRPGDGGIGDMGAVAALAEASAHAGADALALSPMHAGFTADLHHYGPYSPSSRLMLNPLHADPGFLFGEDRVEAAIHSVHAGLRRKVHELSALIDWPEAARDKLAAFRALFESFCEVELREDGPGRLAVDFQDFRRSGGDVLEDHARFEALHAARFGASPDHWNWRTWPEGLRDPASPEVVRFAAENAHEVDWHVFLQWIADRSFAAAQRHARSSGMAIGLISDLAVGMDSGGSHAWSQQEDVLGGVSVGAPPDLFNADGQAWGLAAFSPIALKRRGFAPFLATLDACLKNAGGVRIDHAMGLARLWLTPEGASARDGSYLAYPADDMLRLVALSAWERKAVVIGEDLGTVPVGFRERLAEAGVAGMRVIQFERNDDGFFPPHYYPADALAMTATHDLPTVAGWWTGADIDLRQRIRGDQFGETAANDRASRSKERADIWRAFRSAGVVDCDPPAPDDPQPAVDAAVAFMAMTPSKLALLPLEDAIGQVEQPNLPGTLDEHPNWRRRMPKPAPELLAEAAPAARLESLNRRRAP